MSDPATIASVPFELLHPDEQAERHRRITLDNEARSRERLASDNRRRGIAAPTVGAKLFVTTARGIPRRSRAGLRFTERSKTEVDVTDLGTEELALRQQAGASVVNVFGAEEILADTSLLVHTSSAALDDPNAAAAAIARAAELEAANAALRAELAEARRQAPPDPGDGTSSRLKAAAKVREADTFGAPPGPPKTGK